MALMTKKGIRALMCDAIRSGEVVDMPWEYVMKFDDDRYVFHMHRIDEDYPYDFDAQWEDIISMYEDLWIGNERTYRYAIDCAISEDGYVTLDGVELKYDLDSGTLFADDMQTITPIHNLEEFRRFMED